MQTIISEHEANRRWENLKAHLLKWFYKPNLTAIKLALIGYINHVHFLNFSPIWIMVIAPSGSGKTVLVDCLSHLPQAEVLSDLTPNSFISGFMPKGKHGITFGILQVNNDPILLFKDLTTLLSKREDTRKEIISQLREIFDGTFYKNTGASGKIEWIGRVSVIAVGTQEVEHMWATLRALGERFLTIRWGREDGVEMARFAKHQEGSQNMITKTTQRLVSELLEGGFPLPAPITGQYEEDLLHLAEVIARLRQTFRRDNRGEIVETSEPEAPTRIILGLSQVARIHAALFRRTKIVEDDIAIAYTLGLDSIQSMRWRILEKLLDESDLTASFSELQISTGITRKILRRTIDELEAVGAITKQTEGDYNLILTIDPEILPLLKTAKLV